MKIAEIYQQSSFALSFEVYPPKTDSGREAMFRAVDHLVRYRPGFISCTYGAGGSTRDQTLEIVTEIARKHAQTTTAHLTCVGSTCEQLQKWLEDAVSRGVENIMALRGDPPRGQEQFQQVEGGLCYANELVALIRKHFPQLGIGVAGYPETHQEAPSPQADLTNLKRKVDTGADAVITQLFYDNDDFFRFRDQCAAIGIEVPIIPGILPITNYPQIQRISKMCKARIPESLSSALEKCKEDTKAQEDVGVEHATRQCEGLMKEGVSGIHFYVLNKSEATARVLDHLPLQPRPSAQAS